ncbi:MAG TPA: peptidoglycan DD-metalloendopeptidase family protein [Nevskiales bacterium]|nr:peptidoglycan DD-metalloendopeptidase family protein [Nevskiales bacterium]
MSRRAAIHRVFALAGLCLLGTLAGAEPAAGDRSQELARIRERMQAIDQSLQTDRLKKDSLALELRDTEQAIARLARALRKIEADTAVQEQAVAQTRQQRAVVARQLESERGALRQQVRAAYLMGRQQQAKLLLNQEDPGRLGRVLTYYDYLNRARVRQIGAIREQLERLREVENTLQAQLDQLNALQAERRNTLEQLKNQRNQRRNTLDQIAARIKDQSRELARLREDELRLQSLISSVRRALVDLPYDRGNERSFASQRGKLPWPLRGPVLARFGTPKAGGKLSWRGLWIGAAAGTPVQAVARGRVVYVGWMHTYGLIVIIEHGDGYYSLYGHTQSTSVNLGDLVLPGQVIAQAGDSGGHDKPGVYLEIRNGRNPVNPQQWLRR